MSKDALLLCCGEATKERQDLSLWVAAAFDLVARFADVAFGRHEHEHVSRAMRVQQFVNGFRRRVNIRAVAAVLSLLVERLVAHFYGIHAPRNFDDRRVVKALEKVSVSIVAEVMTILTRATLAQQAQIAYEKFYVEAAFVCFIHDDGVVFAQIAIALRLGQQHPISHHLYERFR